ncbi:antibiotic biosynthesis monooxygenase family protein [Halalkalibacter krulwichiae]|uniref:Heme-degrading monooxygenase HmoB n=1 Tax=Halalkalibacter krulwichiae TaxID=199441 RepID=A0A1X9M924_9BACI|nr:antibiotic biosynthesis monooxygenase [Halalkalibacter krulwichiae]ARK29184.1 Heme-degrading monooxygenase HmoB [Halalkalibacter krulwichiae]
MREASIVEIIEPLAVKGLIMQGETNKHQYIEEKIAHPAAKHYVIFSETGEFSETGYVVINNIPVTEEGRGDFEERFQNRAQLVETEPGFQAIRILRPLNDDTYAVMTVWDDEESFQNWQKSKSYENAHKKRGTQQALTPTIFPRKSFVTTFSATLSE